MDGLTVRAARREDLEPLCRIWELCFGDAAETVKELMTPEMLKNTTAAELEGHVRSFMTAFDGLVLGGMRTSYILALCTAPEFRGLGLGERVLSETARGAFERGAELVCLHPASESLAQWYARLGLSELGRVLYEPAAVSGGAHMERIGAEEYAALRAGAAPAVPEALLRAQELFYGGGDGFFSLSGDGWRGCACVQRAENGAQIRELVCPRRYRAAAAAEISKHLGAPALLPRLLPSGSGMGSTHLMGLGKIGGKALLTQPPYLPFTLD